MPRRPVAPLVGLGMVSRRISVTAADAILVKAIVEVHEGVACVFGESGGELTLAAPTDREAELDEIVAEIGALLSFRARGRPPIAT